MIFGVKSWEVTWSGLLLKMGVDEDNFEDEGFGVEIFSSTGYVSLLPKLYIY